MSGADRLSIGEFSRLTWLSPKALRLYEGRGLLLPDLVDEYTGYRFYRRSQAESARTIALLRRAGMPLDRIGAVLDADEPGRRILIDAYRRDADRAHERAMALLDSMRSDGDSCPDAAASAPVRCRMIDGWDYVSHISRTTAADLPATIERAWEELERRDGVSASRQPALIVVYHGEVGWESDGPIEVRVPVSVAAVSDGFEPAGTEVFVDVPASEVQFPTILRSFDAVREAAASWGRTPSGSPREIYLAGDPPRCQVAQRFTGPAGDGVTS